MSISVKYGDSLQKDSTNYDEEYAKEVKEWRNSLEILAIRTTISEIENKREETPSTEDPDDSIANNDTTEDFIEKRFSEAMDSYDNSDYDGDS